MDESLIPEATEMLTRIQPVPTPEVVLILPTLISRLMKWLESPGCCDEFIHYLPEDEETSFNTECKGKLEAKGFEVTYEDLRVKVKPL